jgi:AcrR family transcriptional regulator
MARTQAADYEQRREAIVKVAARLFAGGGFQGTSVSQLAAAANTSKSLIYHYYPSKEDILYAVMASHIDLLVGDLADVMAGEAGPAERLSNLIRKFMNHYVGAADPQKVLLNELDCLPKDKRDIIVTKQRAIIDGVQGVLVALDPSIAEDAARARVKTMLLFGMINWTHTWFNAAGPMSADDIAAMVLQLILPGKRGASRP